MVTYLISHKLYFFPYKTQLWLTNTICTIFLPPTKTIFTADVVLNRVASLPIQCFNEDLKEMGHHPTRENVGMMTPED